MPCAQVKKRCCRVATVLLTPDNHQDCLICQSMFGSRAMISVPRPSIDSQPRSRTPADLGLTSTDQTEQGSSTAASPVGIKHGGRLSGVATGPAEGID